MKKILYIALVISSIFACTADFEQLNTNPNFPVKVAPNLLFRNVIYNYGEAMSYEGFVAGNLLSQQLTALDFNLFDRHALKSPQLGGNPWPIFYKNLRDNEIVLQQASNEATFEVYKGPALIFKAYMTMALTDLYGDVPYSEAFKGDQQSSTPKYDSQETIYTGAQGILDNLKKGIEAIKNYTGTLPLEGDVLYNGDLNKWLLFANSLQIKALVRISSKRAVGNELQQIVTEGNYIKSAAEDAIFQFSSSEPNNFRMARLRAGDFNNFVMAKTAQTVLTQLNDPRMAVMYRPFGNATGNDYNGLQNGIDASQTTISLADYSLAGRVFREEAGNLKANYMTNWETNFLLAEAAQRGLITGNAKTYYDTGVKQAFAYWNTALPANYLTGAARFDAANGLAQIITQKWIANTINGYEGWIEYRRTGFPALQAVAASLNNNLIPVRLPYPAEEATLNAQHYNTAAQNTSNNSINHKVWWDN